MTALPATGERLVWTGRSPGRFPGGLDGWNTSDDDLAAALEHVVELVVLDPLSFPWRTLSGQRRNIPLVVQLPTDVGAGDLVALLGRPLLQHLTPWDRVIEARPEVREALAAELRLPPEVWSTAISESDPDRSTFSRKTAFRQAVQLVADEIRRFLGDAGEGVVGVVGVVGRSALFAGHLERISQAELRDYSPSTAGPDTGAPAPESPHVVVVWLKDGGESAAERRDVLDRALSLLHPGGRLLVLGYVVTEPGGGENPTISGLVEEILAVSSSLVHVDELRSVRWGTEPLARGVLLGLTSLRVGRI